MPSRAFIDSDRVAQICKCPWVTVLMPSRAFIDSDLNMQCELMAAGSISGLNALTGIY